MALDINLHRTAYLLRRRGLSFEEIVDHLNESLGEDQSPSKPVLHRWASKESSCNCIWHNWQWLLEIDTNEIHMKAFGLVAANHDNTIIAETLNVPLELVNEWSSKEYPCFCGCHGWVKPVSQDLITINNTPSMLMITSSNPVEANEQALLTVIESVRHAVAKGDVVPRSWRDVLDTVKTVSEILGKPTPVKSSKGIKVSETRSVTIPDGSSVHNSNRALANELMQAVGLDPKVLEE
jgi:hypothetical protein